ncbi:hypothetical protein BKA62DRAFT_716066 [Auriculariales sp. MPI-PUGE-AT-0066]|nr:hypothetical protein BKA62DRAFT_716066 [Auriculariales sp. MPI-PUGE-AT-0066]
MHRFIYFALVFVLATIYSVAAAPLAVARDVWVPHIEVPNADTVWTRGTTVTVEWATDDAPDNISNGAAIYLRKGNSTFLDPLATGFDLRAGQYPVELPDTLEPASDYVIVLFGDSGNWSDEFTINA